MNKNDIQNNKIESEAIILYKPNPIIKKLTPKSKLDKCIETFEKIIQIIFNLVSKWVNIIGPCFIIAFFYYYLLYLL